MVKKIKNSSTITKETNGTKTNKHEAKPIPEIKTKSKKINKAKKADVKKDKSKLKSLGTPTVQVKAMIPKAYPDELIVEVKNLPKKYKQIDLINGFNKFGNIAYVQIASKAKALIAYLQPEEAKAAINSGRNILIRGANVIVKKHSPKIKNKLINKRAALVFRTNPKTTIDDIKEHFKDCGKIKTVKLSTKKVNPYFIIEFDEESSGEAALKLHNSVLQNNTIHVRLHGDSLPFWDLKRTIVLLNPSSLKSIDGSTVLNLFKGCGEIERCDVFCDKNRLAILTFKHEDSVPKAMSLNGTAKHGINIEVKMLLTEVEKNSIPVKYSEERLNLIKKSKKSKVIIKKVAEGLTEKDISNLFYTCGPVKSVTFAENRSAVVDFENSNGYCNAFLLHSYTYGGKKLMLTPFTEQQITDLDKDKKLKRNAANENQAKYSKKLKK